MQAGAGEGGFGEAIEIGDAVGAFAHGAEQAETREGGERGFGGGGFEGGAIALDDGLGEFGGERAGGGEGSAGEIGVGGRAEECERRGGVAAIDHFAQALDAALALEAEVFAQFAEMPPERARGAGGADVAEHVPGLDGGELVLVAEQQQARARGDGGAELGHHREIDHGGFIDDHGVGGERMAGVPAGERGVGLDAEQPVERDGLQRGRARRGFAFPARRGSTR